jgi:phospholipid-binding lipoprotein MlaA
MAVFLTGVMMAATMMVSKSLAAEMATESSSLSPQTEKPESTASAASEEDVSEYLEDEETGAPPPVRVADPLEPWNRAMFVFNDKCYFWVLKPAAQGYKAVMPEIFRRGIKNFFYNLGMPVRLVNCVLQGKGKGATGEGGRFLYNTTVGVLGFGNPAANHPFLNPDAEDFGQTLGRYGIGHGVYLVWPLLGPSSIRDTVGFGGDYFLTPTTYVEPTAARVGISAGERINQVSFQLGDYETFKQAALEPYTSARDAYLQYRKGKVEK